MGEPMTRILLIDDDRELCGLLREYLEPEGFSCTVAHNGTDGLQQATGENWDIIILDVMLPGKTGFQILSALRGQENAVPILMLTARGDDVDRVIGLEMGADDYLPKPFNPRELVARMRAILRRTASSSGSVPADGSTSPHSACILSVGDLCMDTVHRRVSLRGVNVSLTGAEFRLLQLLLETPGVPVTREHLTRQALGRGVRPFDRSLDMHISRIRKKLDQGSGRGECIISVRGEGYAYVGSESV